MELVAEWQKTSVLPPSLLRWIGLGSCVRLFSIRQRSRVLKGRRNARSEATKKSAVLLAPRSRVLFVRCAFRSRADGNGSKADVPGPPPCRHPLSPSHDGARRSV